MQRPPSTVTRLVRRGVAALLALSPFALPSACTNTPLNKIPPPVAMIDNELELRGNVCATPPDNAVFPVKILFLVDVSGSLIVTDPADVRVTAVSDVIQKYQGLPGVEFNVITFSSSIVSLTNGFTNAPDLGTITQALSQADNLTDDQGALASAYEALTTDMLKSTPAERARSRYIIILFTDGTPDPICSADTTPCGTQTCAPGSHCEPTTILTPGSQQQEQYACNPDYMICSVPKADWGTAFNPPLDPSLYPQLQAGANYNTAPQLLSSVGQIMALSGQYHVGSIQLNTNFLFPIAALSNPLAVPFALDRPAGEGLLQAMAAAGNGSFQEFTSATDINFLNINFSSIQVNNNIVQTYASNQSAIETGNELATDSDEDGLSDEKEAILGTCVAYSATCQKPSDSDGDGYSDFIEVLYKTSGFDPKDNTKPASLCASPGADSDGDGLGDCEETFLKTDPLNPDTDGDLISDLIEVRNGMNPLDATDAYGDINRDGILNLNEIQVGLSPKATIAPNERPLAFTYDVTSSGKGDAGASECYKFSVQHMRLVTTGNSPLGPTGVNRIYYDVFQTAADSPTTLATVRRACADVLYVEGRAKLPLTGVVNFEDSDFIDIAKFNPSKNCKDLTFGYKVGPDAGVDAGAGIRDGGKG